MKNVVDLCASLLGGQTSVTVQMTSELEFLASSEAKMEAMMSGYMITTSLRNKTLNIRTVPTAGAKPAVAHAPVAPKKLEAPDPNVPFSDYVVPAIIDDILAILASPKSSNLWFYGPTQSGKSRAARYIAYKMGRKLETINCKGDMDSHHFFGYKSVQNGEIVFIKGAVERSMTEGLDDKGNVIGPAGILFIDEASSMPTEIGIGLNTTLETASNVRTMTLPEDGNRVVKSHPDWRVILAGNTNGTGANDIASQAYTAQQCALDASLIQRMSATFRFGYDRRAEETIVRRAEDNEEIISIFLQFKQAVRDALKRGNGELTTPFSTKKVIDIFDMYPVFAKMMSGNTVTVRKIALGKAIYYSIYESLTEEEKKKYDELWYPLTKDKIGRWSPAMNVSAQVDYM